MENGKIEVVEMKRSKNPWKRNTKEFTPGVIERREEYRATIIDTNVSLRQNIERNLKNYLYY